MTTQITDTRKLKTGDRVFIDFEIDKQVPASVIFNKARQVGVETIEKYPRRAVFDIDGDVCFTTRQLTLWA